MVQARFSDKMIEIIKSMVGNVFCSYECGKIVQNEVYGNLQINLDEFSIEILNEVKELPFYDSTENISYFSCEKKSLGESFKPYCDETSERYLINEKVLSVYIVDDSISINDGEYDINFDMAIIIETDKHKHIFTRGWFFSETIGIFTDQEFDDIYPVERVVEDWADDGDNKVNVERRIRKW